jgi:selT/selW/selH-like putative selenoprotein
LAAVIREEFEIETQLVKGVDGVFDVVADGRVLFSKHEQGRFPSEREVLEALRDASAS